MIPKFIDWIIWILLMRKLVGKIPSVAAITTLVGGLGLLAYTIIHDTPQLISTTLPHVSVAAAPVKTTAQSRVEGNPVELSIPSLDMVLPIIPGTYNELTRTWTLTTDKVQFASITPPPNNEGGNTFLYGHYRKNVFANLHNITPGDIATIKTENGKTFYYRYVSSRIVDPTDSEDVFNYSGKPIVTIQTCTGLFYEKRQLFTFDLVRVA